MMIETLDEDQVMHARDLVNGALKRNDVSKRQLREALSAGHGRAQYRQHPSTWPVPETPHDRAVVAAHRLLLRLGHELGLPIESPGGGPSAISIASELLQ